MVETRVIAALAAVFLVSSGCNDDPCEDAGCDAESEICLLDMGERGSSAASCVLADAECRLAPAGISCECEACFEIAGRRESLPDGYDPICTPVDPGDCYVGGDGVIVIPTWPL